MSSAIADVASEAAAEEEEKKIEGVQPTPPPPPHSPSEGEVMVTGAAAAAAAGQDGREGEDAEDRDMDAMPALRRRNEGMWKMWEEGETSDWWFASTGIPLLAATLGPLANVTSIAALVTSWRQSVYIDGEFVPDFDGEPFGDPRWCYWLNVASLIFGFLGNLFLLLNFTQRIRYLLALPFTIIFWYLATGFLIGITACMHIYARPVSPHEIYTQGFWYAIASASIYFMCSMLLMVNMLGYFLGHYPDTFQLSESQRTLILQSMAFFIWLAGGAAVFSKVESDAGSADWKFADALYFCDVTILTVGFGDLYPNTDVGRGLVFPYSVGGTITLALIVSSLYKFVRELGEENIVQRHVDRMRERTLERTVANSFDLRQREHEEHHLIRRRDFEQHRPRPEISAPFQAREYRTAMGNTVKRVTSATPKIPVPAPLRRERKPRLILLREEKDRFDAMRRIQHQSGKFRKWTALTFSVIAFGILWCVGAVVFWQTERGPQGMSYFQALYFCYVSLLTIGYGDLAPKSNPGRVFFVVWSLIAVPTMTILVSDLGDTVVDKFKKGSDMLADFTVLPKQGIWRGWLEGHPRLLKWIQEQTSRHARKKRLEKGFETADPDSERSGNPSDNNDVDDLDSRDDDEAMTRRPTLPSLAQDLDRIPTAAVLSRRLALSINNVSRDLRLPNKKYTYEEWVAFTRLIRYSSSEMNPNLVSDGEDEDGLLEWDWLGENSPLISGMPESEWLLQKLCESLVRLEKQKECACGREDETRKSDSGKEDAHGPGGSNEKSDQTRPG